ncbi:MAG: cupin domain-containing protein [Pseudomonadales bacterium]
MSTGIWTSEPGTLKINSYPVDEVFTVLSGKIEATNEDGSAVHVGPGQTVASSRPGQILRKINWSQTI